MAWATNASLTVLYSTKVYYHVDIEDWLSSTSYPNFNYDETNDFL